MPSIILGTLCTQSLSCVTVLWDPLGPLSIEFFRQKILEWVAISESVSPLAPASQVDFFTSEPWKTFTYPHNGNLRLVVVVFLFHRWGIWDTERLTHLSSSHSYWMEDLPRLYSWLWGCVSNQYVNCLDFTPKVIEFPGLQREVWLNTQKFS